jgi:SAM-dependent methyltransferase
MPAGSAGAGTSSTPSGGSSRRRQFLPKVKQDEHLEAIVPQIDYDAIAEIYDLYATADYDIPFFLSEVGKVHGAVLELMAGTGRLSVPLLEAGATITCVDSSNKMLDVLKGKLARGGLHAEVRCMDVRELDLPSGFELAILPFQAFMELVWPEDQRAALAAVFRCLSPGGRFICTLHNPQVRRAAVDGVLRAVGRFPAGDGTLVVSGFERGGDPVVTRTQFFEWYGTDGRSVWKRMLPMEFTLIEKGDFEAMARGAGFRVRELWGSYDRAPFDPSASPFMIWVLEKAG